MSNEEGYQRQQMGTGWNVPTYNQPWRVRGHNAVRHNPRWDKTMKHIKGEMRQGRL